MAIEKKLHRSGPYADLFSQGVQVGTTLYLAGQVGMDDSGAGGRFGRSSAQDRN